MSVTEEMAAALDATGLEWREGGWAPFQPPQSDPYLVVDDSQDIAYDDAHELYLVTHHYSISLYDYGDAEVRYDVRNSLMASCLALTGMQTTGYSKETKLYETVYGVSEQFEKVRVV